MKLKNKLIVNFGILFFLTINIFAFFIIESNFNKALRNMINSSLGEYSVIYNTIKTGEELNNLFLTNKDIIKIKSESYLNNISNLHISLEFRALDDDPIYSNNDKFTDIPKELFNLNNDKNNYMVIDKSNYKLLLINNKISLNESNYNFTYIRDIDYLYKDKISDFISLININIIVGILLLIIIYIIAVEITKPLSLLISNIDKVIHGNYNKKLSYTSDISELNLISTNFDLMNEEIQNKITELKYQNTEKQRFIENLTHEIRTPLTSIIGYSRLMLDKNVEDIELLHNSLTHINKEGNRILLLTSNLIHLITLNKESLNIHPTSLIGVLKEIEASFSLRLQENDAKHIYLKIYNNSIEITDTGIGISSDDLVKIFEPFYMADKSRQRSLNGFGLGLSICNAIIKILNIDFNIESNLNIETTIVLSFKREDILWRNYF